MHKWNPRKFAGQLSSRRQALSLTQADIEQLTAIEKSNIGKYERSYRGYRDPKVSTLEKLAQALKLDPVDFFEETDDDQ